VISVRAGYAAFRFKIISGNFGAMDFAKIEIISDQLSRNVLKLFSRP